MSYASLAAPALPPIHIPIQAIRHRLELAFAIIGVAIQCLGVAALLWVVLAAPGLMTDRNSTGSERPALIHR